MDTTRITPKSQNRRKLKLKVKKLRSNSWRLSEQVQYLEFLIQNRDIMATPDARKSNKVFKRMADALQTRTSKQAKSHHQKLVIKYKTLSEITKAVAKEIAEYGEQAKGKAEDTLSEVAEHVDRESTVEAEAEVKVVEAMEGVECDEAVGGMGSDDMLFLASYCSFFDEYSENCGRIDGVMLFDQYELFI